MTSHPIRVLQILMCDGIGGTEGNVVTLAERVDPREFTMEVVTLSGHGPVAQRLAAAGIRVRSLGRDAGLLVAARRLTRIMARERFDVVNAYGFKATFIARAITRAVGGRARFICGVRGLHITEVERIDSPRARAVMTLERLGSGLVDIYDANSTGALEVLADAGIPRGKLRYIPNGVDLERWRPGASADPAEPVVICAARFTPIKRQLDLVLAAEELAGRGIRFKLVLAGDGPCLESVRTRGSAGGRIVFPGPVDLSDMPAALAAADVFCLPSLWEGMANSVMEAMACGLPVVGTAVNGINDLVVEGETGLLVQPESPGELADALERLLTDGALRMQMGEAGRRRVERDFSLDAMVAAKTALYDEIAGPSPAVRAL